MRGGGEGGGEAVKQCSCSGWLLGQSTETGGVLTMNRGGTVRPDLMIRFHVKAPVCLFISQLIQNCSVNHCTERSSVPLPLNYPAALTWLHPEGEKTASLRPADLLQQDEDLKTVLTVTWPLWHHSFYIWIKSLEILHRFKLLTCFYHEEKKLFGSKQTQTFGLTDSNIITTEIDSFKAFFLLFYFFLIHTWLLLFF